MHKHTAVHLMYIAADTGKVKIWNGEIRHIRIVPNLAMVFKNRSRLLGCHGGHTVPRGINCPTSGSIQMLFSATSCSRYEPCFK